MGTKTKQRIGLSIFFFLAGLTFASWTSRIPTIKSALNLNEAELGSLLFVMPISSFIGLGASGWLIERFDSRWPLLWSFIALCLFIIMIGNSNSVILFGISIFLFAFANRILHISINTQAITLQNTYHKKINSSFHGLWSLGGIAGVGFTTLLVSLNIGIRAHFYIISTLVIVALSSTFRYLIKNDKSKSEQKIIWRKPDPKILILSTIILLTAICEGGMFDWSGVYFKEVVKEEVFSLGYFVFMIFMASSRFTSDWLIERLGTPRMFLISSSVLCFGFLCAVIFPTLTMSLIGFALVGIGTAAIIPMTLNLTGTTTKFSPGMAIALVSTFSIIGVLAGPPAIGWIAHVFGLRFSFLLLAVSAFMIIPVSRRFFRIKDLVF